MKSLIIRILRKFLTIGNDKLLHAIFGIVIAEVIMLLPMTLSAKCIAAFIGVVIVELLKETMIDASIDWKDVLATIVGCLIGIGFTALNIMLWN